LRYAKLPKPAETQVPYAKIREELRSESFGGMLCMVLDNRTWQRVMAPILDEVDRV
jgi:hypothetical protein